LFERLVNRLSVRLRVGGCERCRAHAQRTLTSLTARAASATTQSATS